jgi:hypothetical protein
VNFNDFLLYLPNFKENLLFNLWKISTNNMLLDFGPFEFNGVVFYFSSGKVIKITINFIKLNLLMFNSFFNKNKEFVLENFCCRQFLIIKTSTDPTDPSQFVTVVEGELEKITEAYKLYQQNLKNPEIRIVPKNKSS